MTLPITETVVSYADGSITGTSTVVHTEPAGDQFAVVLDRTPCHPVDAGWPDQGADQGSMIWNGGEAVISDCVVAAFENQLAAANASSDVDSDGPLLHLGGDIPVRKGTVGWTFVVAHLVSTPPPIGLVVTIDVNGDFRRGLSLGHTGCHLAALALNRALADRWMKEVPRDGLGTPDFDALANDTSKIQVRGSVDTYRLGKSLRKKGFTADQLAERLPEIQGAVNASLQEWIGAKSPVRIDRDGDLLTDRRYWVCELPEASVSMACGGTHARNLGELGPLKATLALSDEGGTPTLTMTTSSLR